ncbi:MAG: hypothetical protein K2N95_05040 [Lachnospiraceae bacterium]|nr:hypothetical protein [Lachnospiraceae bacterium]
MIQTITNTINQFLVIIITNTALSLLYSSTLTARQTEFTIKQDGSGDFSSISEAVASVPSESTLVIYEGVYNVSQFFVIGRER